MDDTMLRSRRALLAGALGAIGGVGLAFARPIAARAGVITDGDPVILGESQESAADQITHFGTSGPAFQVVAYESNCIHANYLGGSRFDSAMLVAAGGDAMGIQCSSFNGYALNTHSPQGHAIKSDGRLRFDGSSGVAFVPDGSSSVVVTPTAAVKKTSRVIATLQTSAGGTTTVHRVTHDAPTNTITIHPTAPSTRDDCKVAWFMFEAPQQDA